MHIFTIFANQHTFENGNAKFNLICAYVHLDVVVTMITGELKHHCLEIMWTCSELMDTALINTWEMPSCLPGMDTYADKM